MYRTNQYRADQTSRKNLHGLIRANFICALAALMATSPLATNATAQTFINVNAKNRVVSIPLTAEMAGSKIIVSVLGKDADAQNLSLALEGPAGLKLNVSSLTVRSKNEIQSAYQRFSLPAKIYGQYGARIAATANRAASNVSQVIRAAAVGGDPNCGCFSEQEKSDFASLSPGALDAVCRRAPRYVSCDAATTGGNGGSGVSGGGVSGGGGGSTVGNGSTRSLESAYINAFIESNRCLSGGKPAAVIELDLSGVAASDLKGDIKIKTKLSTYGGNRRAAIKPASHGGIFPGQPLLLAAPVGGVDSSIKLLKYSGARRTSLQQVPEPDRGAFISYRGYLYWRRPISNYLSGGKGVFQMSGSGQGYSICVNLDRTRQNLNGYKN